MNEIEIMNACARELKLASFKENTELYAQDAGDI